MDKQTYREIYLILNKLGKSYIEKIPEPIYEAILQNMSNEEIENKAISKEAIAFIAGLHYKYWAETPYEKAQLLDIFNENEKKKKAKINPKLGYND